MLAHYAEKVQRLQDQIAGRDVEDASGDLVKSLKKRLRKTETALRSAQIMVNGITKDDGKGWQRAPIAEKIATTESRLEQQREAAVYANEQTAELPFDVDRLKLLISAAELGEDVEFPTDLKPLSRKEGVVKSDEETEADFIASEESVEA
jgi:hypothetical protein